MLDFVTFALKEVYESKHQIGLLLIAFFIIPGLFVYGTVAFEQALPQDVPIGVAPAGEDVSDDAMNVSQTSLDIIGTAETFDSKDEAVDALEREEVYIVFVIPEGIFEPDKEVELEIISDNSIVPLQDPVDLIAGILGPELDSQFQSDLSVVQEKIGPEFTLSEYLTVFALLFFTLIIGLIYIPYKFKNDEQVFDRINHDSSLYSMITGKILFYTLSIIPIIVSVSISAYLLDYQVNIITPGTFIILLLMIMMSACIGTGILFLAKFSSIGLLLNITGLISIITFSSIIYPPGFFSELEVTIAEFNPYYYIGVILRGHTLRNQGVGMYSDMYSIVIVSFFFSIIFLYTCTKIYLTRK